MENDPSKIDLDLETRMDYAQRISSLVLSIRKKEKIRVRQPLQKILLPVLDPAFIGQIEGVSGLILSEVNVKEIEFITLPSSGRMIRPSVTIVRHPSRSSIRCRLTDDEYAQRNHKALLGPR